MPMSTGSMFMTGALRVHGRVAVSSNVRARACVIARALLWRWLCVCGRVNEGTSHTGSGGVPHSGKPRKPCVSVALFEMGRGGRRLRVGRLLGSGDAQQSPRRHLWQPCQLQNSKTVWPSGLRRWLQAPVRKGVGSNPTAVISFHSLQWCQWTTGQAWHSANTIISWCRRACMCRVQV